MDKIRKSVNSVLEDMDIVDFYTGTMEYLDPNTELVKFTSKLLPDEFAIIRVEHDTHKLEVKLQEFQKMKPIFAELLLENLAIQIDSDYYDD